MLTGSVSNKVPQNSFLSLSRIALAALWKLEGKGREWRQKKSDSLGKKYQESSLYRGPIYKMVKERNSFFLLYFQHF